MAPHRPVEPRAPPLPPATVPPPAATMLLAPRLRNLALFLCLCLCLLCPPALPCSGGDPPDDEIGVAVLGSSVAAGWVTSREVKHDLGQGWAARLGRLLEGRGLRLTNVSVPGDDTAAALARLKADLAPVEAEFVFVGLSLGNEGLAADRATALRNFRAGMPRLIDAILEGGRMPVLGLCYPSNEFDAEDYAALVETNLWLQGLEYPCVNFLGAIDDGGGHLVAGHSYDAGHPDNRGHEAMFRAIVPSVFAAILDGKPTPERLAKSRGIVVRPGGGPAPLSHVPADVIESFAVSFRLETAGAGAVAAVQGAAGFSLLSIDAEGHVVYTTPEGSALTGATSVHDGRPHAITLSHRHLLGRTELFVDGERVGFLPQRVEPRRFVLGGAGDGARSAPPEARFGEWWIHRSALTLAEVKALGAGAMLAASLEVYAPLDDCALTPEAAVENRAQSAAVVLARPSGVDEALAHIDAEIARAHRERAAELVVPAPEVIELAPALLEEYVGTYEIGPGDRLVIRRDGAHLVLVDGGNEIALHALDETTFFIRTLGEPQVSFARGDDGGVSRLLLGAGGRSITAPRVRDGA